MLGVLLLLAKSLDTILERWSGAPKASEEARVLFNEAARAMLNDHSFGIGINMYSHVLEHGGYADRLGMAPVDRSGVAHHIYWLTAAELGYVGLAAYALLLIAVLVLAIKAARARDVRGDIALGIAAGLFVTYVHGTSEWILRQTAMSYAFWTAAAMVAAFLSAGRASRTANRKEL
jgi:O-antigen ligase